MKRQAQAGCNMQLRKAGDGLVPLCDGGLVDVGPLAAANIRDDQTYDEGFSCWVPGGRLYVVCLQKDGQNERNQPPMPRYFS